MENSGDQIGPCEPSIVVHPINQNYILAATVLDNYHLSKDGGRSWIHGKLNSEFGVYGDPCVITDERGIFYYFHLGDPSGQGRSHPLWLESIVMQKSTDLGVSWTGGIEIGKNTPKQQDKEWAIANQNNGDLYVSWTEFDKYGISDPICKSRILFSKSKNRGENWSEPIVLSSNLGNCADGDQTTEGAVPAAGPNNEIYISWALNNKIYFDKSFDGGLTWQEIDQPIGEQPGGWETEVKGFSRSNGFPVTACDVSESKNRGTIYVNWVDTRNGKDNHDVFLIKSNDRGITWTDPIRVNQDTTKTDQFFTWMTVDPTDGNIYFVFYDRSETGDLRSDVTLVVSEDGGETFESHRLNLEPFSPPGNNTFFGDYNNISARNGVIRPIWTEYHEGKLSVWTALVDF